MTIATLILAAGASSRMGKAKQLLPVGNTSMLRKVIAHTLDSKTDDVFVVLGAEADLIKEEIIGLPVKTILNVNYKEGLSSSIIKGVKQLFKYDAILIVLADQIMITGAYLNDIISELKSHQDTIIATDYNGINGVPCLFPKLYYQQLLKLKGDKGAKQFLNSNSVSIRTIISPVNLIDIDTPEDYQSLIQSINSLPTLKSNG